MYHGSKDKGPFYDHQSEVRNGEEHLRNLQLEARGHNDHFHDHQSHAQGSTDRRYRLRLTKPKTNPFAWCAAVCCALLWTVIILGGLAVLIVYLVFRPRSPRFEVSSVSLNGAYLDTGTLLNADITMLANFSNPNRKVDVSFGYVAVDLYFRGTLIATQGIEPFSEKAGESTLRTIHMVSSEVVLSQGEADAWTNEVGGSDGVKMEVKGSFRTTSDFVGIFLRITYSLYGRCSIAVSGPPSGVLLSSNCTTKRAWLHL